MPGIQPPNELIKSWEWERERQQKKKKKKKLDERVERMKGGGGYFHFLFLGPARRRRPPLQSKVETGLLVPESPGPSLTERQSYPSIRYFFSFSRLISVPC